MMEKITQTQAVLMYLRKGSNEIWLNENQEI